MSPKLLIALQYWGGDREAALRLARFLADLEPAHTDLADFMLLYRFDTTVDQTTINHLSRKFNTHSYRSPRRGTGWPAGCNDLWFSVMDWVYSMKNAKKIPDYKAIFTCEADGCPLPRDWIARLSREWDRVNTPGPVVMAGAMLEHGPHINGNALISGDMKFLSWITRSVGGVHPNVGWDFVLASDFRRWGWVNLPGVQSLYRTPTFSEEDHKKMIERDWIWVHGVKDDSLIRHGRKRFSV